MSKRVTNMPKELFEIMSTKMKEIDPKGYDRAIESKDGSYLTGLAARACTALQIREKTNKNDGVMVEMIQKVGGGKKGWAWCMYQVQACIGVAEKLTGITSLFPVTGSCASAREGIAKIKGFGIDFSRSKFGVVWIKKYPNGTGHTEIFDSWIRVS